MPRRFMVFDSDYLDSMIYIPSSIKARSQKPRADFCVGLCQATFRRQYNASMRQNAKEQITNEGQLDQSDGDFKKHRWLERCA